MNSESPYYPYGRITPWPSIREIIPEDAFAWYFQSHVVGNADHLAANPDAYIASLDATIDNNAHLRDLPDDTLLMVTIPVSGNESDTIYETLKLYTTQGRAALRRTQFVLIVNQEKGGAVSPEELLDTYDEITRAQKNFPELQLTVLSINWPKMFAKRRRGGLYSAALKIVTDTCMRAAWRKHIDPLIITNDANPRAISQNYLLHYMRALHEQPTAQVFLGKIHWDIARMRSVPGYGFVATVLMAAQDRIRETASDTPLDSWAANTGYRASALAAIGGIDGNIGIKGSERGFGADIDVGRRFFAAHQSNDAFCMVHEAWVDSYGDRLLRQYVCNKSLTRAWDECDNNASSAALRLFVDMHENVAADFDHIRHRIELLLGLMLSDRGWACFDDESVITAAMHTALLGTTEPASYERPLWSVSGKRYERTVTFTDEGTQRLQEVLPYLADLIHSSLMALDDMTYSQLRANKKILKPRSIVHSSPLQKRHIGSRVLSLREGL